MTNEHGEAIQLHDGLLRVRAPNPSPMTYSGTNSYIVGKETLAIIDPGPVLTEHRDALQRAIAGRPVSHVIVTHSHLDHAPLAPQIGADLNAPVVAFGKSEAGRSSVMKDLAARGFAGGGEGVDTDFAPDVCVPDGTLIEGDGWQFEVIHTPGHMGNHICLAWDDIVFTGDLVMGWASSLVSPPDGDLTDFMASCERLLARNARVLHAGHGELIGDPTDRLKWLISHRQMRSDMIMTALHSQPKTIDELTAEIYIDVSPNLRAAAARNVFAHLIDLTGRHLVRPLGELHENAQFTRK